MMKAFSISYLNWSDAAFLSKDPPMGLYRCHFSRGWRIFQVSSKFNAEYVLYSNPDRFENCLFGNFPTFDSRVIFGITTNIRANSE